MSPQMAFLLQSVAVLTGLAGLLAALLVAADAWIADYGDCVVAINDDRRLTVRGGDSLLNTLAANRIYVPSACGGRGTCAYCKVRVIEGGGPLLPMEEPYLTPQERADGVRLSCQVKVRRDLRIRLPEELFRTRQFNTVVERLRDLTYDIKELRLRLTDPSEIAFKAGQYIQLQTQPYEGVKDSVFRAYSMSSPPQDRNAVELIIRLVPDGICTTWVFRHLKEGQPVVFNGPYGDFYLRPTEAEIICVAGGSGFAPIKSILQGHPEDVDRRGARFFFGARAARDLFHTDLLQEYAKAHPRFEFIPALSEPQPSDAWAGETGLITEVLARRVADAAVNKEYYLCGSPGMIAACVKTLRARGVGDDKIFYDSFG